MRSIDSSARHFYFFHFLFSTTGLILPHFFAIFFTRTILFSCITFSGLIHTFFISSCAMPIFPKFSPHFFASIFI